MTIVQVVKRDVCAASGLQTGAVIITKILGWDVRPLMAAGGFSGIVLGLATQSVLANALAGLQLVSSIPVSRCPSRLHPEPCHACTSLPYTLCSNPSAHLMVTDLL